MCLPALITKLAGKKVVVNNKIRLDDPLKAHLHKYYLILALTAKNHVITMPFFLPIPVLIGLGAFIALFLVVSSSVAWFLRPQYNRGHTVLHSSDSTPLASQPLINTSHTNRKPMQTRPNSFRPMKNPSLPRISADIPFYYAPYGRLNYGRISPMSPSHSVLVTMPSSLPSGSVS